MVLLPMTSIHNLPVFTGRYGQTKRESLLLSISSTPVKFIGRRRQTLVPMLGQRLMLVLPITSILFCDGVCRQM
jgi:hypothetical protein